MLPYSLTSIERNNHAYGLNKVGLERRGFTAGQIAGLRKAYRLLRGSKMNTSDALTVAMREMLASDDEEHVRYLVEFVAGSERGA